VVATKKVVRTRGFSIQAVVAVLLSVVGSHSSAAVTVSYLRIQADLRGLSPTAFHMDLFAEGVNTKRTLSGRM